MNTVSLSKGQTLSLAKQGGRSLSRITVGSGWGRRKGIFGSKSVDLDASCILVDSANSRVDQVWFNQTASKCGSIVHGGDDRSGGGDATKPNETIDIMLDNIPAHVETVFLTINSFLNDSFKGIPNAFINVVDKDTSEEVCRYDLSSLGGDNTALVLGKFSRSNGGWEFTALEIFAMGRTIESLDNVIANA